MSELIRAEEWHDRWQESWKRLQTLETEAESLLTPAAWTRPWRSTDPDWISVLFADGRFVSSSSFTILVAPGETRVQAEDLTRPFAVTFTTSAPLQEVSGTLALDLLSPQLLSEIRLGELMPGVRATVVSEDASGHSTVWGSDLSGGPHVLTHPDTLSRRILITLSTSLFTVSPVNQQRYFRLGFAGLDAGRRKPFARLLELVRLRPEQPLVGVRVEVEGENLQRVRFTLQIDPGDREYGQELEVVPGQTIDLTRLPVRWRYERVPVFGGQVSLSQPVDNAPHWNSNQNRVQPMTIGGRVRTGSNSLSIAPVDLIPRLVLIDRRVINLPQPPPDRSMLEIRYPALPSEIVLLAEISDDQPAVIRSARLKTF